MDLDLISYICGFIIGIIIFLVLMFIGTYFRGLWYKHKIRVKELEIANEKINAIFDYVKVINSRIDLLVMHKMHEDFGGNKDINECLNKID